MNWENIIVEIIGLIKYLSWPCVSLIVFFNLKKPISTLMGNIKSGSFKGLKFDFQNSITQKEGLNDEHYKEKQEKNTILNNYTNAIKNDLDKIFPNKDEREKREDILIDQLAQTQLSLFFEKIYRIIWDSQVDFLEKLNVIDSCSKEEAHEHFKKYISQLPNLKATSFENWTGFLIDVNLIIKENDSFRITEEGINFLTYLMIKRYQRIRNLPV